MALFVLLSLLAVPFSTDAFQSMVEVKGLLSFLLVALVAGLVDDADDAHLVVDALRLTTLYLVLRGLVDYFVLGFDNVWERLSGGLSIYMTYAGLLMVLSLVLAAPTAPWRWPGWPSSGSPSRATRISASPWGPSSSS
ncbi:MAG: hypothetical protein KJ062_04645 [Thermoanaerobaculia bacterium]|nr:hypothetical protein [Thermoanaerobaculia bacterium]